MNETLVDSLAIEAVGVEKSFGMRRHKVNVLKNVNLNVLTGSMYGLLGPSGCGKTTLLRCLVGTLKVSKGYVKVFGKKPGSPKSDIPGRGVGYMPQELALYNELTAKEILAYFGRLYCMTIAEIENRTDFVLDFLKLPKDKRLVINLSGGQRRRVSFAIALLHEPPLLILDEPTVGVDPVLRSNIWEHLLELSRISNVTTVITTHYIEEAKLANKVALMRNGCILAEEQPQNLINKHNLSSLEEVFLKICQSDDIQDYTKETNPIIISNDHCSYRNGIVEIQALSNANEPKRRFCIQSYSPSIRKIWATAIKNFIKTWRNLIGLFFQFVVPSLCVIFFAVAVGGDFENINVVVLNEDLNSQNITTLATQFLSSIDPKTINQLPVDSYESGVHAVQTGEAWGFLNIRQNFSRSLIHRFWSPKTTTIKEIYASTVHVRLDMTDQQIALMIQKTLYDSFLSFGMKTLKNLGQNENIAKLPVEFVDPIYGELKPKITVYVAPAIISILPYFMALGLTLLAFIVEDKEGLLERSYVAGVSPFEIMSGYIVTQLGVMIVQVSLILIFLFGIFEYHCEGNIVWVTMLAILLGLSGMTTGYLISAVFPDEATAGMVSLGYFFILIILSGCLWSMQAIPGILKTICYWLPLTYSIDAMRSIVTRGYNITHMPVWRGYLVCLGWIGFFLVLCIIVLRFKK